MSADERLIQDVVRVADGLADAETEARLHAEARNDAELTRMLERQQHVARTLAAGGPVASDALRRRVAAPPERRAASRWSPLRGALVAGAVAAVALIALFVSTQVLDSGSEPSSESFAALSLEPATGPAPPPLAGAEALLSESFAGVSFPNWEPELGWQATGARTDRIDGREAYTVFYEHHGHRINYTVVDGPPLQDPDGAVHDVAAVGIPIRTYRDGERDVVTFTRNGHTCVLAGDVIALDTLVKLAAWSGDGAVQFS